MTQQFSHVSQGFLGFELIYTEISLTFTYFRKVLFLHLYLSLGGPWSQLLLKALWSRGNVSSHYYSFGVWFLSREAVWFLSREAREHEWLVVFITFDLDHILISLPLTNSAPSLLPVALMHPPPDQLSGPLTFSPTCPWTLLAPQPLLWAPTVLIGTEHSEAWGVGNISVGYGQIPYLSEIHKDQSIFLEDQTCLLLLGCLFTHFLGTFHSLSH